MMNNRLLNPKLPLEVKKRGFLKLIFISMLLMPFLPWISFSVGDGQVTAINPSERIQGLTASVNGFVKEWYVKEGDRVTQGQLIAELIDNDPAYLERLETEKNAAESGLASAELMMKTAKINLERQKQLFEQGLTARKDFEKAKIEYSKLSLEYAKNTATFTKSATQLSRQSTQKILAPRNGSVTRILPGERGQLIKAGTTIAIFAPDVDTPAVEVWIDGNDASMLIPGQEAQIQFEGWPALQIAGWPSIAIGTFKGKVHLVDQASSKAGKFRVLLTPDSVWPSQKLLRLGVHAKSYIKLNDSFVLREIWRILNGFPAVQDPIKDELNRMLTKQEKE